MNKARFKDVILDPMRSIYIKKYGILVISDLHIGIEESNLIGIRIQTKEMLDRLERLIKKYKPKKLIINGDLKHTFNKESLQEWDEIKEVLRNIRKIDEKIKIILIKGNHDLYLENIASKLVEVKDYVLIGKFLITHGHKKVEISKRSMDKRGEKELIKIIGDEHPAITLRDELGINIKLPIFLICQGLIVLPAFNLLSKGSDILRARTFSSHYLKNLENKGRGECEVFAINGDEILYFGKIKKIKDILKIEK